MKNSGIFGYGESMIWINNAFMLKTSNSLTHTHKRVRLPDMSNDQLSYDSVASGKWQDTNHKLNNLWQSYICVLNKYIDKINEIF